MAKADNNEQYSRRNSIRIFGLNEEEGKDCCDVVLDLCENVLEIEVDRDQWGMNWIEWENQESLWMVAKEHRLHAN